MDDYRCDHFDCACPAFVTDGRVSDAEWGAFVAGTTLTREELLNGRAGQVEWALQSAGEAAERGDYGTTGPGRLRTAEEREALQAEYDAYVQRPHDEGGWRVGQHYGIHVYERESDRPVATFFQAGDANLAVRAVNLLLGRRLRVGEEGQ